MKQRPIIVVGGGIGGLSAAIMLAAEGLPVTLLESNKAVGGKLRQVRAGDFMIDSGPTVLTLRSVFEQLFAQAGADFDHYVTTRPLDILARHVWPDGSELDLYQDVHRSTDAIGQLAGQAEAKRFQAFCRHAERIYQTLESPFIKNQQPTLAQLIRRSGLRGLPGLMAMNPFATMWDALTKRLHDPRLQQLFGRYATYCGSSPFDAPAVLMLIAHVEQSGVWSIDGGMQNLVLACHQLATELGCKIKVNARVSEIRLANGRVTEVVTANGESHAASAVVFNGDPSALAAGLLGSTVKNAATSVAPTKRSLSAVTVSMAASISGFTPDRHNVFFSPDYAKEFDELFRQNRLPSDPTVYLCAQNRGAQNRGAQNRGAQNRSAQNCGAQNCGAQTPFEEKFKSLKSKPEPLFCLVNAPANADINELSSSQLEQCQKSAFDRMQQCGLTLEYLPEHAVVTSPAEFQTLFPATGGALYGQASHHWRASFSRPATRTAIAGLYLAGGATHPGPGVPMASISGQLAARMVLRDMGLT